MTTVALILLYTAGAFYALWVLYLAVMNLRRVKLSPGGLPRIALIFGTPLLVVGLLLDFLINAVPMSIILLELPRELTVSARLERHNQAASGWRKRVVQWFEPLLDPFDPSGNHI